MSCRLEILPVILLLLAVSCGKLADPSRLSGADSSRLSGADPEPAAVEFSAYAGSAATKAVSYGPSDILGRWDSEASAFVPGTGIGVFAFYQKAKSNGWPSDFDKYTDNPNFMYNQKLERTTTDGSSFKFEYSPRKYWPNNTNDQLSFFAYAPYKEGTAWEDLQMEVSLKGDRISRRYVVEPKVEDQTDFMWADPVLNLKKTDLSGPIDFEFKHLCAKIGVSCKVNTDDDNAFVTVDRVVVRAKFNVSGEYVYDTAAGTAAWETLAPSALAEDYVQFNAGSPEDGQRVRTETANVGGESSYLFPLPGVQDIVLSAVISQHNGDNIISGEATETFPSMRLEEGKAYNFFLNITVKPIDIGTVAVAEWSVEKSTDCPIP